MIIYENDPNKNILYTSKMHVFLTVRNIKIRKHKNNTKSHFFEFLIKSIKSGVKTVYDRGNLH